MKSRINLDTVQRKEDNIVIQLLKKSRLVKALLTVLGVSSAYGAGHLDVVPHIFDMIVKRSATTSHIHEKYITYEEFQKFKDSIVVDVPTETTVSTPEPVYISVILEKLSDINAKLENN